ncbi:hypothetical protein SCUP234_07334 [Seiridium cupressi]
MGTVAQATRTDDARVRYVDVHSGLASPSWTNIGAASNLSKPWFGLALDDPAAEAKRQVVTSTLTRGCGLRGTYN